MSELGEDEYDKDGNPTGRVKFNFKTGAFLKRRDGSRVVRKIPVFDSMAQPVMLCEELGNGTEARVSFSCNPYFVEGTAIGGVTLYLNAVQLTHLVKYGERNASDFGFSNDTEGGFTIISLSVSLA